MNGEKVVVLCPMEPVALNMAQGHTAGAGPSELSNINWAEVAVEDLIVALTSLEAAWCTGEFSRLFKLAENLKELAEQVGLQTVADVANDTVRLANGTDNVALSAVVARLVRVGETSLATMFEIGHQQI